jgi:hypothetical protein
MAFWRTSELGEMGAVAEQLEQARELAKDDLVIGATFFSETRTAKLGKVLKSAARIAVPALAGAGLLVAGMTALPAVALAGALGLFAGAMAIGESQGLQTNLQDYIQNRREKAPEGLEAWRIGTAPRSIENLEKNSPSQDATREMLAANMVDFPKSFHIVHANGHGKGANYAAGLPADALAGAINEGAAKGANEVDAVILDTCYGANFEFMTRLGPAVKYVVAFQDAIPNANSNAGRIPLQTMLAEATKQATAREMAIEMADVASDFFENHRDYSIASVPVAARLQRGNLEKVRQGTDSTVAAIDMEALKTKLHPALDQAGAELSKVLSDPRMTAVIAQAKENAEIETGGDLIDLGGFLSQILEHAPKDGALEGSLKSALQSLDETLIAKRTGQKFPLSGLSVHTRERPPASREIAGNPTRPLDGDHLPKGWVTFIKAAF